MKKFYVNVTGGLGLNIALASFITTVKEEFKDEYQFYVLSPYFDVFESAEAVDGTYKPQEIRDFIFDAIAANATIITTRLYDLSDFIYKKLNYSQAWAQLFDIPFTDTENGTRVKSILTPYKPYPALKSVVDNVITEIHDKGYDSYIIAQFTGGQSPLVQVPTTDNKPDWSKVPYDYNNEPLKRHYPINNVQLFVDYFHTKNPTTAILLYQLPNEPKPEGDFIFTNTIPYLAYYELAKTAKQVITIDSSLQHLVAGVAPTTVIWGHSLPSNFGYSYNNNIVQECRRDDIFYFTALGPSGARISYITPDRLMELIE